MVEVVEFSRTNAQYHLYAERGLKKRIDKGDMTEEDARLIRMFVSSLEANADISPTRAYKVTNTLSNITKFIKTPYSSNTILDVYEGITQLKAADRTIVGNSKRKGKLSPNTIQDYVKQLKRFYLWLIDEGFCTSITKDKITKIKNPSGNKLTKTADMMLTDDDINRMLSVCRYVREKALISTLYESGCRIHEIGKLQWKDVTFDRHFAKISTNGKTGIPRTIPLTASRGYLAEWKNAYPSIPEGENPVFITGTQKSYTYPYLKKVISEIADRAGIQKHVTPHTFRHSRITNLIRQGASQSVVSRIMWGTDDSDMFQTYLHLTDMDSEREIGRLSGFDIDEGKEVNTFKPRICPRCLRVNAPDVNFCSVCGSPLTDDAALDVEGMKEELHADARYVKLLQELQEKVALIEGLVNIKT